MSISATLANALTGLTAASRSAQVISSNVANATTEGYARRELLLSSRNGNGLGAGVQVDGVQRIVDEALLRDRRLAEGATANAELAAGFYRDLLDMVGEPDQESSLLARFSQLETALIEASSRPESETRLTAVLIAARSLAGKLANVSDGIQTLRQDADARIGTQVQRLNDTLSQIAELNGQILRAKASNQDCPGLLDQRQKLVDEVAKLVPLREMRRDNGALALYSMNGALLVDVTAAKFGFFASATITPDMTQASGALSGLTLNGQPVLTAGGTAAVSGGVLAGLFAIRDEHSVRAQAGLDEVARDLISRFEEAGLDPSLSPGDPGLFTDGGAALDPQDSVGLAARIKVNTVTDPDAGGAIWRIRDGLGASAPGNVGDASLLSTFVEALAQSRMPSTGIFGDTARDAASFASSLTSSFALSVNTSSARLAFETARFEGLREDELAQGVDTDQEMQKLLLVEQAYAANARVIQTADELIQLLIGL